MRPIAVELAFDPTSDRRLAEVWARVSTLYDGPTKSELGVHPHITLALFRDGEPRDLGGKATLLAAHMSSFRLDLVEVSRFPGTEGVVFLRPHPSGDLAHAHATLYELLGDDRDLVHAFYQPGAWHPHCTIATDVPETRIDAVLAARDVSAACGVVEVVRVQTVRYRPATLVHEAVFQGPTAHRESN